jgi:hypothetical protein
MFLWIERGDVRQAVATGIVDAAERAYELYYVYADVDEPHLVALDQQLRALERQGLLHSFSRRKILAGEDWQTRVDEHVERADIILLLISPALLDSKYSCDREVERAMLRHARREAVVVPVVLRPCMWELEPFAQCRVLPPNARPVTMWDQPDLAFCEVARGVHELILDLRRDQTEAWLRAVAGPKSERNYATR